MSLGFLEGQPGVMRARGYETWAISSPGEELDTFGTRESVGVRAIEMTRRITPLRDVVALARLVRELRTIAPDIVHAHTPKGGLLGMIAGTLARVPVRIYHMRGLPMMTARGPKRALLKATERVSCALATRVLCVSHSLREVAAEEHLCSPSRVEVLLGGSGNGVDARGRFDVEAHRSERAAARRELGIDDGVLVVGFVGRIVREKGIVELIEAWSEIEARWPSARLVLVGPFEAQDPVPDAIAARIRAGGSIVHVEFTRKVAPLYAAMDLVVLPTWREGFPNVPLEAAAMELPVVATRIPGCVDAVADGETGTLVPARDRDALGRAIARYLEDGALRAEHGRRGRARVLSSFARDRIHRALGDLYDRSCAEAGV
jgi:glycosyltransferase involved in cell wall biosynthesis